MSFRMWRERVQDILDAVEEIQQFTAQLDSERFQNDVKTVRAVELDFIVIGEAATAIPDQVQERYPAVPWHLMRGMRNRLVHAYFAVDEQVMWDTVQNDLPVLKLALTDMLDNLSALA